MHLNSYEFVILLEVPGTASPGTIQPNSPQKNAIE